MQKYEWINSTEKTNVLAKDKQFWSHLSEAAYPITRGKMRIPISLEPFIIKKNEYDTLSKDLTLLISAAKKLAQAYYTDQEIAEVLAIDTNEQDLIAHAKDKDFTGIVRVDLFFADSPKVVEINADYPDGFFMHDVTANALEEFLPKNISNTKNHLESFSDLLFEKNITKNAHIFIGFDKERTFIDDFYLAKTQLETLGWKNISVGNLDDLGFKNGNFYYNETKVDVLRRGSELSKIRAMTGFIPKLLDAEKNGLIVINNFKMRLLGYKSLMAGLWDKRFHKYLDQSEVDAIEKILPRTYKLNAIEKESLINEKNTWVIKPIDLAEGTNVFMGQSCTDEEWISALDKAYSNPTKWIAQEKVVIPKTTFNLAEDNHSKISSYERGYDCNPHIILMKNKIELGKILVRFSDSQVVNVAKGGGITYAFPVER